MEKTYPCFTMYVLEEQEVLGPMDWISAISDRMIGCQEKEWVNAQTSEGLMNLEIARQADPAISDALDYQTLSIEMEFIDRQLMGYAHG